MIFVPGPDAHAIPDDQLIWAKTKRQSSGESGDNSSRSSNPQSPVSPFSVYPVYQSKSAVLAPHPQLHHSFITHLQMRHMHLWWSHKCRNQVQADFHRQGIR